MQTGGGIGRARAAGDEADAGRSGELAHRLRHDGSAALLTAGRHRDRPVVERVKRGDIAFARHAKNMAHAVDDELIDQHLAAGPRSVIGAHGILRFAIACIL